MLQFITCRYRKHQRPMPFLSISFFSFWAINMFIPATPIVDQSVVRCPGGKPAVEKQTEVFEAQSDLGSGSL